MYELPFNRRIGFLLAVVLLKSAPIFAADCSSPRAAFNTYWSGETGGDSNAIGACYPAARGSDSTASEKDRNAFQSCRITSEKKYASAEIERWNKQGIIPPLKAGDVEIIQTCMMNSKPERLFYSLRKVDKNWQIITHSAENGPE